MRRLAGVLLMVLTLYAILVVSFPAARSAASHVDLARRLGFYGVLTLGVGTLIIAGGIDLSIGALVGLSAVAFGMMIQGGIPAVYAALAVVVVAPLFGLFHGLMVTKLKLQPFLVTLCGLFVYRGVARTLTPTAVGPRIDPYDLPEALRPQAEALQAQATWLANLLVKGTPLGVPNILIVLLILAALMAVLLHRSVWGRYLYAVGSNEQAARYAGINADGIKIFAYVLCSAFTGLGGVLYLLEYESATPSTAGTLLELYAITGAVLGGCSLRGGIGTVPGMLLGAAVLPLLNKLCNFTRWIGSEGEYIVIGTALLLGTVANELIARWKK
ncbi:MAG: ABC transporter permease [Gemmataceae bacterium]